MRVHAHTLYTHANCLRIYIYIYLHFIGKSEEEDLEEEEEEEFIREGIKNALRAKERLEKAEFLEVCMYVHIHYACVSHNILLYPLQKQKRDKGVECILNLFSEEKNLLVTKRPQFGKATVRILFCTLTIQI